MNKTALMVSVALTAFVLIAVAVVFLTGKALQPASAATISDIPLVADEQLQQALNEREAAYQDLINQANSRLDKLQKENQALQAQLSAVQNDQQVSTPAQIQPETAAQVAASWLGDNQVYSVESTTIQSIPVFKVTFSSGVLVYVSAEGQVIGSQAPAILVNASNNNRHHSEDDEHEGFERDDD
jgi:predicted PurR-regulated permease PerM